MEQKFLEPRALHVVEQLKEEESTELQKGDDDEGGERVGSSNQASPVSEAAKPEVRWGTPLSRSLAVSYIHQLQAVCNGFRGFRDLDVHVLSECFRMFSLPSGTKLWNQEDEAAFFALVVKGECLVAARHNHAGPRASKPVCVAERGDFVGQAEFFQPAARASAATVHSSSLIVMVFNFGAVQKLSTANPDICIRLLRLAGESACTQFFAPGAARPRQPFFVQEATRREARAALEAVKGSALFEGVTTRDMDVLVDCMEIVPFAAGDHLFFAGHQARAVYTLLSGTLESRWNSGQLATTFSQPGEVFGEAVLPNVVHKANTRATTSGKLIGFALEDLILKLGDRDAALACKLTSNTIRCTLVKLGKMLGAPGLLYDPEQADDTAAGQDVKDLESLTAQLGVPKVLMDHMVEQSGETRESARAEVNVMDADTQMRALVRMHQALLTKTGRLEKKLEDMVPKTLLHEHMAASERTRQEERRRRADIAAQLEEAVKLNEALKMNDAETNKTRSQKEVEWQERLSSLEQQLMEAKRDGEVAGQLAAHRRSEAALAKAQMTEKCVEIRNIKSNWDRAREAATRSRGGGDVLQRSVQDLVESNRRLEQRAEENRQESVSLHTKLREAEAQARVMQVTMEEIKLDALRKQQSLADTLEEREKEVLPRFQQELALHAAEAAHLKWSNFAHRLRAKYHESDIFLDMLDLCKMNKESQRTAEQSHDLVKHIRDRNHMLEDKVNSLDQAVFDLQADVREAAGLRKELVRRENQLGQLTCWLLMQVLDVEKKLYTPPTLWGVSQVKLLSSCWTLMQERNALPASFMGFDIEDALRKRSTLAQRASANFVAKNVQGELPDHVSEGDTLPGIGPASLGGEVVNRRRLSTSNVLHPSTRSPLLRPSTTQVGRRRNSIGSIPDPMEQAGSYGSIHGRHAFAEKDGRDKGGKLRRGSVDATQPYGLVSHVHKRGSCSDSLVSKVSLTKINPSDGSRNAGQAFSLHR